MPNELKLFSGNSNKKLAENVAKHLGLSLGKIDVKLFKDGEIYVKINEKVRGEDVFIIQPTCGDVNRSLMELLIMLDAFRRASAKRITAVIPYFGYQRQDRKAAPREPITARLVADLITAAGANRVLAADLHADQIQGFFDIPVDHIMTLYLFADYLKKKNLKNIVFVAPDAGSAKRTRRIAKLLDAPMAIIDKRRPKHNVVEVANVIGHVKNKIAIIVDDIIDTGGTIAKAADAVQKEGAKEVFICATHAVLSGDAVKLLGQCKAKKILLTDTVAIPKNKIISKMEVLTVAPLLASVIQTVHNEKSLGDLFDQVSLNVIMGNKTKIDEY